ncbi:MAG: segregation/condensation protein A [Woeseiaceae bacterium]|nr:segregation/condensation protein A [Woeseiaceae bacterium]NNK25196.1 segregation/condensation protein A [Woeseiaceae bacterium]
MKPELKVLKPEDAPKPPQDEKQSPAQGEMPFAVVDGEPVTTLPQDLYIPPYALQVFLEAFEGPLDLLLYLIRRQNLDILDIPIAEITKQYVQYIELMKELQLELAGEYLLMAAMLAEIKSRMLLPRPPVQEEEEDDPRAELVRRLQEYERYKKAAEDIAELPRLERDVFVASADAPERKVVAKLPDVTMKELLLAFHDVLKRAEMFSNLHMQREPLSVRQRMSEILSRIKASNFTGFADLFDPEEGRMGVAVTFIAILELLKESVIDVVQSDEFAPLHVRAASTVHLATEGGEQVDLPPDEQSG